MQKLPEKLVTVDELSGLITSHREQNEKIVWTNGCFDILHVGHVEYLEGAKKLGDYLVVGLNSDHSTRALKGAGRPIFSEVARSKVLSAVQYIDYVLIFDEPSPLKMLEFLKPDFYVKGGDYDIDTIDQQERRCVEGYGGKIVILPLVKGASTTEIIEKINRL
ncbi:D-glycero-beta-D-manno-heptose 1-phosphate adenylyltransferase [candidate division KSB1 bacterium]|nr:D-glycero-beta-D-manno-heptose 1-phosphate adenylyltransferase [candidate division KSB1 bacterium]